MPEIVIDANVLVSAIFGGLPNQAVWRAFQEGTVFVSPMLEQELLKLPEKSRNKLAPGQILEFKELIRKLFLHMVPVKPKQKVKICRDPKDNACLELCLAAGADFLVTGDKDLLTIPKERMSAHGLGNLTVLTAAEFCRIPL